MSKIQIEEVKSLDEEQKVVLYRDLSVNRSFLFASDLPDTILYRKIANGFIEESTGSRIGDEAFPTVKVIPVKAKILWCREGGGE